MNLKKNTELEFKDTDAWKQLVRSHQLNSCSLYVLHILNDCGLIWIKTWLVDSDVQPQGGDFYSCPVYTWHLQQLQMDPGFNLHPAVNLLWFGATVFKNSCLFKRS